MTAAYATRVTHEATPDGIRFYAECVSCGAEAGPFETAAAARAADVDHTDFSDLGDDV